MKSIIDWVASFFLIIGGLNWGLVGLFDLDVITSSFGAMTTVSKIIYTIIGLSALWMIYYLAKDN